MRPILLKIETPLYKDAQYDLTDSSCKPHFSSGKAGDVAGSVTVIPT
jgi:hypothetical protein